MDRKPFISLGCKKVYNVGNNTGNRHTSDQLRKSMRLELQPRPTHRNLQQPYQMANPAKNIADGDSRSGYRSRMRGAIRQLRAHAEAGESDAARQALPATLSLIDATAQKGIIHRNTAARYKSRLTKLVAAQPTAE